jgi:hypothetical protein
VQPEDRQTDDLRIPPWAYRMSSLRRHPSPAPGLRTAQLVREILAARAMARSSPTMSSSRLHPSALAPVSLAPAEKVPVSAVPVMLDQCSLLQKPKAVATPVPES